MSEDKKKETAAERAWAVRRARTRRITWRFAIFVGVPTALAVLYYGLWAANEYVSTTVVAVQSPAAGEDDLGGTFVQNRADDSRLVRDTIRSRGALEALTNTAAWRDHYASAGNMFSSLSKDAGSEEAFDYYRERLKVTSGKGLALRLSVRAFSPEAAAKFSGALLELAEKRLNEVALRPLVEQEQLAKRRLEKARAALVAAPTSTDESTRPEDPEPAACVEAQADLAAAEEQAAKLELAKVARTRYLTIVSGPSIPTEAAYPKRLWSIATVFVIAFSLMGVFSLLLGAVREHAKV